MDCSLAQVRAPQVRTHIRTHVASISLAAAALLLSACSSLNPFSYEEPESVPSSGVLQNQNQVASGLLSRAQNQLQGGQASAAENTLEDILDLYPFSSSAAEAQYLLGDAYQSQGKYKKAIEAYQDVLTRHPNSGRFSNALESIFNLAESAQSGQIQTSFLGISRNFDQIDIISWYESVVRAAPRSPLAPKSLLTLGQLYAEDFQRNQATQTLQRLVREYPNSSEAPQAQILLADVISNAGAQTNESRSLSGTRSVLEDLGTMFGDDPEVAEQARDRIDQINTSQAANDLKIAQFYEKKGNMRAATIYYREVLRYQGTREFDIAQARLTDFGVDEGPLGEGADAQLRQLAAQGRLLARDRPDMVGPLAPQLVSANSSGTMRDDMMDLPALPPLTPGDLPPSRDIGTSSLFIPDVETEGQPSQPPTGGSTLPDITDNEVEQAAPGADQPQQSQLPELPEEAEESTEDLLRRAREKLRQLQESSNTQQPAADAPPNPPASDSATDSRPAEAPPAPTE